MMEYDHFGVGICFFGGSDFLNHFALNGDSNFPTRKTPPKASWEGFFQTILGFDIPLLLEKVNDFRCLGLYRSYSFDSPPKETEISLRKFFQRGQGMDYSSVGSNHQPGIEPPIENCENRWLKHELWKQSPTKKGIVIQLWIIRDMVSRRR